MLGALSDKTHFVMTAVCVAGENFCQTKLNVSEVTFAPLSDNEITAYIATSEPMDKAGAYGIQGIGGAFVRHLSGSFSAVMGSTPVDVRIDVQRERTISGAPFVKLIHLPSSIPE